MANFPSNGNTNDASGSGGSGNVLGATLIANRFNQSNAAYEFDGIDDWIQATVFNLPVGTSERTLSLWAKAKPPTNHNLEGLVEWGAASPGRTFGVSAQFVPLVYQAKSYGGGFDVSSGQVADQSWHHRVATYGSGILRIFVDGVQRGAATIPINTGAGGVRIGVGVEGGNHFAGQIDDIRIYNRALSPVDVARLFATESSLTSASAPVIVAQPASATTFAGQSATFSISATSPLLMSYQWQRSGVNVLGATNASYTINAAQSSDAGAYVCFVANSASSTVTAAALLTVVQSARLTNVSVRTTLASAQSLIVGFTVSGGAKDVLVRAAGPALVPLGVTTAMADPKLELFKDSTKLLENDNWPGVLTSAFSSLGAFPFSTNSRDAGMLQNVNGGYSAVASGTGPGVVLVEIYDAGGAGTARLVNLSARNRVGTGDDILIAGFYLTGTGTKRLLIRAVGPTIGGVPFNVPNTLVDPKLDIYDASGAKLTESDNWDGSLAATFASVGAFPFAPNSKDAALVTTLNAGTSYSVWVRGVDGGTGEALVEIYELP